MITVINLACIRGNEILLVEKKGFWILPGGKQKTGETDRVCLERELKEELPDAGFELGHHYDNFEGLTPHTREKIGVKIYLGTFEGGDITPAAEISDAEWIHKDKVSAYRLSDVTQEVVESLLEDETL